LLYINNNHIGFYPYTSAIEAYKKELEQYHTSKGTVRFPLDKHPSAELNIRDSKIQGKGET
jgi:uncharacterized protein YdhG (YjbR/CyaY superfamily)